MKPIYCFKLDEFTGHIKRIVITEYTEYHPSIYVPNRCILTFVVNNYRYDLNANNIGEVKNWKYFSYEDDISKAKEAFTEEIKNKARKAKRDYTRYTNAYEKLWGISGDAKNRNILSD